MSDRYSTRQRQYKTTTRRPTEDYDGDDGDYPNIDDYTDEGDNTNIGRDGLVDMASNSISQCPVENGLIRTSWGAVSVGPLLSGIAAGLKPQSVATRELLLLTRTHLRHGGGRQIGRQQVQLNVDNRWAATLAGE